MKIVVVDDEFTMLALIKKALELDGHSLSLYSDAKSARDEIDETVDLVVSDLFMPGMNGDELFDKVRERYPEMPFVYLTGADDTETAVGLIRRGATDFILKPTHPEALRIRIQRVMYDLERRREIESILREQELVRRENQRLTTWRMLYASKDVRQTRQLVDNLSRSVSASGGLDWVDLMDDMKQEHDQEHYLIPRAVVDLAIDSARNHQSLLHRITEIGMLHGADPIEERAGLDHADAWLREVLDRWVVEMSQRYDREISLSRIDVEGRRKTVRWDDGIMEGMLHELVCNAIKYSPEDSPIGIDFVIGRNGAKEHLAIQVRNRAKHTIATDEQGRAMIGVPDEYSEQVFELFFTIESFPTPLDEEKWTDGTGLYYVRTMARLLGGWAEIRNGVDYSAGSPVPQVITEVRLPLD